MDHPTNLRVLKRTRRKPEPGDIFAMQLPDRRYLFGRVIGADLESPHAPMPGSYLVYVYAVRSADKQPDVDELTPANLLIPPEFINRMPWTRGYFETVDHRPLHSDDLLRRHCFWSNGKRIFVDEKGAPIPARVEPCGQWALASYRTLDDRVSDALGIPRVPE